MRLIHAAAVLSALTLFGAGAAMAQAATQAPTRRPAARTPHSTAAKADCLSCHAPGANEHIKPVPAAHRFPNERCVACHRPADAMPAGSTHAMDALHTRCAVCHVANSPTGAKATPASHTAYHATTCAMCHEPKPAAPRPPG